MILTEQIKEQNKEVQQVVNDTNFTLGENESANTKDQLSKNFVSFSNLHIEENLNSENNKLKAQHHVKNSKKRQVANHVNILTDIIHSRAASRATDEHQRDIRREQITKRAREMRRVT